MQKVDDFVGAADLHYVTACTMLDILSSLSPFEWTLTLIVAFVAGTIKGLVGFAMPMIMISGLSSVVSPELALAGLIFPTLATNGFQAMRQGWQVAWASIKRFRIFLMVGGVMIIIGAQLVSILPPSMLLLGIGIPISIFALMQVLGRPITLSTASRKVEIYVALVAGFIGGLSGVWGPPTVAYLTALGTEKKEQVRIQGVIYGLGAVLLLFAHIASGVVRSETVPFSVAMLPPALIGMWLGGNLQDRIDQNMFRKVTIWVLLIAGLNLIRRALMG